MTAQSDQEKESTACYFHIYREVGNAPIFIDNKDYQVFVEFLNSYFSDSKEEKSTKKTFTIRGRSFTGVPHQPQNFYKQVELLAYKLEPNRFDLLIEETSPGSLEKFTRALSTRYAIYFNKKHNRAGNLFNQPYQSHQIKDLAKILELIRELHINFSSKDGVPDYFYSSYPEYLGQRVSKWIKPQAILSSENQKGYQPYTQGEKSKIVQQELTSQSQTKLRIPEIILATLILTVFSSFALVNIETSKNKTINLLSPLPKIPSQVSGVKTTISSDVTPTPTTTISTTPLEETYQTSTNSADLEKQLDSPF